MGRDVKCDQNACCSLAFIHCLFVGSSLLFIFNNKIENVCSFGSVRYMEGMRWLRSMVDSASYEIYDVSLAVIIM